MHGSNDGINVTVPREKKKDKKRDLWVSAIDLCKIGKKHNNVNIFGKLLPALLFSALVLV